ncbi:hypothetical protein PAAG_09098, partial [Paracoccidioides lutzii Pb01]
SNQTASQNIILSETAKRSLHNVKSDYHKLIICNENNYYKFITKFLHLTGEVKIVNRDYKTDFNDKLFFNLQRMIAVVNTITNTYIEFQKICTQVAYIFQIINIFNSQTLSDTSATKFYIMKKTISTYSDIQWYYCKEKNHITRNYFMK